MSRREALALAAGGLGAALVSGSLLRVARGADAQQITLYVFTDEEGIKGPDGRSHDTFVPSSFVVKAGVPARVTVINYDDMPHTITAPDLGLNGTIKGGHKTHGGVQPVATAFTFTAAKRGVYRWFCALPCDDAAKGWAMERGYGGPGEEGFMAGNIVVL